MKLPREKLEYTHNKYKHEQLDLEISSWNINVIANSIHNCIYEITSGIFRTDDDRTSSIAVVGVVSENFLEIARLRDGYTEWRPIGSIALRSFLYLLNIYDKEMIAKHIKTYIERLKEEDDSRLLLIETR